MSKKKKKKEKEKDFHKQKQTSKISSDALPIAQKPIIQLIILIMLTVICLAPFADKAFHIDDPLFLWTARQIQNHPADFYGFLVNWEKSEMPMHEVTKNPPLTAYYIALVASLIGWSEIALHLAFLIPAIAVALGTYFLARQFCMQPVVASLAGMLTPVFLVSSTSVMCDTMMLAFWVWAVFLWVKGIESEKFSQLFLASIFIAASALTKYFGMSLIPLLLIYSLVKKRRIGFWLLFLSIPVIILVSYQWFTHMLYGKGLLSDAASYASSVRKAEGTQFLHKGLIGLAFTGGCLISVLFYSTLLWSRRLLTGGVILAGVSVFILSSIKTIGLYPLIEANTVQWDLVIQLSIFAIGGLSLLALTATDFWKRRDAVSLLLFLWISGTFIFATFINWTINARSILPIVPAVGIMIARRIDQLGKLSQSKNRWYILWPLIPAAVISLFVTWADYTLANTARSAATQILHEYKNKNRAGTIWFQGHWGFQYYMESGGGKAIDITQSQLTHGDVVIIPLNNDNIYPLPHEIASPEREIELVPCRWLSTSNYFAGAGFYAHFLGPLPFRVGHVPPEKYFIFLVTKSIKFIPEKT